MLESVWEQVPAHVTVCFVILIQWPHTRKGGAAGAIQFQIPKEASDIYCFPWHERAGTGLWFLRSELIWEVKNSTSCSWPDFASWELLWTKGQRALEAHQNLRCCPWLLEGLQNTWSVPTFLSILVVPVLSVKNGHIAQLREKEPGAGTAAELVLSLTLIG